MHQAECSYQSHPYEQDRKHPDELRVRIATREQANIATTRSGRLANTPQKAKSTAEYVEPRISGRSPVIMIRQV